MAELHIFVCSNASQFIGLWDYIQRQAGIFLTFNLYEPFKIIFFKSEICSETRKQKQSRSPLHGWQLFCLV